MKRIPLTKGYFALVDDDDFIALRGFKWYAVVPPKGHTVYAARTVYLGGGRNTSVYMHCSILGVTGVDHKDSNGLNNQRYNLRPASQSQNLANQRKTRGVSRFKGVVWVKARNRWQAQISVQGKRKFLGRFDCETDAAIAYNDAASKAFGEYARLNVVMPVSLKSW